VVGAMSSEQTTFSWRMSEAYVFVNWWNCRIMGVCGELAPGRGSSATQLSGIALSPLDS
jgi:hypothetical protein